MHAAEFQTRRLLDCVNHLGIILSRQTCELDLNRILAASADDWLGHAHTVETLGHNFDRVLQLLSLLELIELILLGLINLQSHTDPSLQVEAEAELALRSFQDVLEQDVVALILIRDVGDINLREKLSKIDRLFDT